MSEIEITDELMDEVRRLREMDEDDLYAILGRQSLVLEEIPTKLQFSIWSSMPKLELMAKGKTLFNQNKQDLKKIICDDWGYCKKMHEYTGDLNSLIVVVVPVVTTGLGLPTSLIAVLCVIASKYGIKKLCECDA